jgi:hypothetical protein
MNYEIVASSILSGRQDRHCSNGAERQKNFVNQFALNESKSTELPYVFLKTLGS